MQFAILLLWQPGWSKYWVLAEPDTFQYWDAGIYAQLAIAKVCTAFYPLWPQLIETLRSPMTVAAALRFAHVFSEVLFWVSIPIALWVFGQMLENREVAFLSVFLYVLGPNAIFHSIGYTESLFGLLSLLFLLLIHQLEVRPLRFALPTLSRLVLLFVIAVWLNLTRPILLQSWFAIAVALGFTLGLLLSRRRSRISGASLGRSLSLKTAILAGTIGAGSLVGYGIYGYHCWQTTGNFFTPFIAQVTWGRTVGFRPWLLLLPRSLLMDLHSLYLPALLLGAIAWMLWRHGQRSPLTLALPQPAGLYFFLVHPLVFIGLLSGLNRFAPRFIKVIELAPKPDLPSYLGRFSVLYAIAFASAHALINFFANDGNLYSSARHVFGSPFIFLGLGAVLTAIAVPSLTRLTWRVAVVGVALLAQQWVSYTAGGWLG
ncbi:MAG TPA: hypothetical protein V6D02_08560 [Candidatus Obscuribacterales bacterium]